VTHTHLLLPALTLALLIGVVAGLRSFTAPAVVAWGALLGWISLNLTWAHWVGNVITVVVLTLLAAGELVMDKLPNTPAEPCRRCSAPGSSWAHLRRRHRHPIRPSVDRARRRHYRRGARTLGGYQARKRLVAATGGKDLPIALLEDAVAILAASRSPGRLIIGDTAFRCDHRGCRSGRAPTRGPAD